MDMARKFLQMGYTRARRYANHASGKKFETHNGIRVIRPQEPDWETNEKAHSACIFYEKYLLVKKDRDYSKMKADHHKLYEL